MKLQKTAWIAFGVILVTTFIVLKLSEDRIHDWVQSEINQQLAPEGILFSAAQSTISIGLSGVSYTMKQITLRLPASEDLWKPSAATVRRIDQITVTPSLFQLLLGHKSGKVSIQNLGGDVVAYFSTKPLHLQLDAHQMDIRSLGVVRVLTGVDGGALLSGHAELEGDTSVPSTLNGRAQLQFSKITVESQSFMGFFIPPLNVSSGTTDFSIDRGKLTIQTLRLGRASNAHDDIHALITSTGENQVGAPWSQSVVHLRASFGFSTSVLKAIPLMDPLLSAGKQIDGSYAYELSGSLGAPVVVPLTPSLPLEKIGKNSQKNEI
jgi:type II secretion system protein N